MKRALVIVIMINLLGCLWIVSEVPFIKMGTDQALRAIQEQHELLGASGDDIEGFARVIQSNHDGLLHCLKNAKAGGLTLGAILLVQNIVLLLWLPKTTKPNKSEQDDAYQRPC